MIIDRIILTVGIASFFVKIIGIGVGIFFGVVFSNFEIFWVGIGLLIFALSLSAGFVLDMLMHGYIQRKRMLSMLEQQNKLLMALGRRTITGDASTERTPPTSPQRGK